MTHYMNYESALKIPMNSPTLLWPGTLEVPPLSLQQVHVWAWDLDVPPLPHDWEILSKEETLRGRRFVFPQDRDRFVRAHSVMRRLLGSYSDVSPAAICFSNNAYGKPQILTQNAECLHFNLTHSAGIAALAVSRSHQLGVDVEVIRAIGRDVAEGHFSARELLTLRNLTPESWQAGFYRCWTSKEALLKGEGLGLNMPLDAFDVEAHPERPPALLGSRPPASIAPHWRLIELKPARNALGTLALLDEAEEISDEAIEYFSFSG